MKRVSLFSISAVLLTLFSCSGDDSVQSDYSVDNSEVYKNNTRVKSDNLVESKLYSGSGKILMIHDKSDEEVYFLQLNSDIQL